MPTETVQTETKAVAMQKQDYVRGLLRADPGIPNGDINHYLEKKFRAGGLNDKTIDNIRAEMGWKRVGRGRGSRLVRIGEEMRTEGSPEAKAPTERVLGAPAPTGMELPPQPEVTPRPTPTQAGRSGAWTEEDERRFVELVIQMQTLMERHRILQISIPRKGDPHIQEVAERDIPVIRPGTTQH